MNSLSKLPKNEKELMKLLLSVPKGSTVSRYLAKNHGIIKSEMLNWINDTMIEMYPEKIKIIDNPEDAYCSIEFSTEFNNIVLVDKFWRRSIIDEMKNKINR